VDPGEGVWAVLENKRLRSVWSGGVRDGSACCGLKSAVPSFSKASIFGINGLRVAMTTSVLKTKELAVK